MIAAVKADALGFLRATDVVPSVRALGIDGANLFGEERLSDLGAWPLMRRLSRRSLGSDARTGCSSRPATSWATVASARPTRPPARDPEYLLDGGTSKVSRLKCCSYFNYTYPVVERTGNQGAVRSFIQNADFAMANLESGDSTRRALPRPHVVHLHVRSVAAGRPANAPASTSCRTPTTTARTAASSGLSTAIDTLDEFGILHAGAGVGPAAAAEPAITEVNGVKLAIISLRRHRTRLLGQARTSSEPTAARKAASAARSARSATAST